MLQRGERGRNFISLFTKQFAGLRVFHRALSAWSRERHAATQARQSARSRLREGNGFRSQHSPARMVFPKGSLLRHRLTGHAEAAGYEGAGVETMPS